MRGSLEWVPLYLVGGTVPLAEIHTDTRQVRLCEGQSLFDQQDVELHPLCLCLLAVGIIGLLPRFLPLLLPHVVHIQSPHTVTTTKPTLLQSLQVVMEWFLIAPIGFVVEEVFFRGTLGTHLHRGEEGTDWLSAIFVSALWGLWHLPTQAISSSGARAATWLSTTPSCPA
jgi:membrane protease YdiL (CAAX protease family)